VEGVEKEELLNFGGKAWKRHRAQTLLGVLKKIYNEEIAHIKGVGIIWQV